MIPWRIPETDEGILSATLGTRFRNDYGRMERPDLLYRPWQCSIGGAKLGIRTCPIPRNPGPSDILAFLRFSAWLREVKPDVVHGHGSKGGMLSRMSFLSRAPGDPIRRAISPYEAVAPHAMVRTPSRTRRSQSPIPSRTTGTSKTARLPVKYSPTSCSSTFRWARAADGTAASAAGRTARRVRAPTDATKAASVVRSSRPTIPRDVAAPIPFFGRLTDLRRLSPGGAIELRPFALGQTLTPPLELW